jgi:PAS domain S-box-containing protein
LYVWLIYHFFPISAAARDPKFLKQAVILTSVFYPPFALIGGVIHHILERAANRVSHAKAVADMEQERRRIAEAELWTSEEMRNLIVDSSVDAVIGIGPDGKVILWSPTAEKLFGWSRTEALDTPAATKVVAPAPAKFGGADLLASIETTPPLLHQRIETSAETKSGDHVDIELYIVDHKTEKGNMYFVFAHDISERKKSEHMIRKLNADLRELNASLEKRVADRTQELEAANEELLGFTYSVSHDLRAPLRSIVSNSRIVREDAKNEISKEVDERLERLEGSALKMAQQIDSLLQYARIGRAHIVFKEVNVSAIAARIVQELKGIKDGAVTIQPDIVIWGDPEMVEIVLANLLENAWKYVLPSEPLVVEVGRRDDGVIFIRDEGIGFDMQYLEKIWAPFQRLHQDSEYPGTGIGLANVKRIIERHGGRIWAESKPGVGTTMYLRFPDHYPAAPELKQGRSGAKAL